MAMSGHSGIIDSLRETGYRLTPQRMMVVSILHDSKGHISAEEIHARVQEHYPYVDISTVYRTLQLLKRLHFVTETNLGGGAVRYELSRGQHHHLVCQRCSASVQLEDSFIQPLRQKLRDDYRFEADLEHFAILGLCERCHESQTA